MADLTSATTFTRTVFGNMRVVIGEHHSSNQTTSDTVATGLTQILWCWPSRMSTQTTVGTTGFMVQWARSTDIGSTVSGGIRLQTSAGPGATTALGLQFIAFGK